MMHSAARRSLGPVMRFQRPEVFTVTSVRAAVRTVFSPTQPKIPRFPNAAALYANMRELTKEGGDFTVHNYMGVIEDMSSPEAAMVETELFPRETPSLTHLHPTRPR